MAATTRSITVRRPVRDAARVVTDPAAVMAAVSTLGRAARTDDAADGAQQWSVFIVLGTMYMGGTVRIDHASDGVLAWHAVSGFRHSARFEAVPDGDGSTVSVTFDFLIGGAITGRLTARLVQGYVARSAEAVLEQLRHSIEFPD
ncbi:SRPBCC family protein [Gordonia shandongensis]|uniref:SRPBCC family protein n=1 Tax=Gordonia shandongensis TaxID=376351 RepID=UPI0004275514|nr:SRPBCC family protein [Gordonia shandongensis]